MGNFHAVPAESSKNLAKFGPEQNIRVNSQSPWAFMLLAFTSVTFDISRWSASLQKQLFTSFLKVTVKTATCYFLKRKKWHWKMTQLCFFANAYWRAFAVFTARPQHYYFKTVVCWLCKKKKKNASIIHFIHFFLNTFCKAGKLEGNFKHYSKLTTFSSVPQSLNHWTSTATSCLLQDHWVCVFSFFSVCPSKENPQSGNHCYTENH